MIPGMHIIQSYLPCFNHSGYSQGKVQSLHGSQTLNAPFEFSGALFSSLPIHFAHGVLSASSQKYLVSIHLLFTTLTILTYFKFLPNITHLCILLHHSLFSFPAWRICVSHKYFSFSWNTTSVLSYPYQSLSKPSPFLPQKCFSFVCL